MKQASEQYRKEMQEPWRGQWLLNIYIGLIRERFQSSAVVETSYPLSFLSNQYNPYLFQDHTLDTPISTFEKNVFKADGSSVFTNENHDGTEITYHGLVSEALSNENGEIDFQLRFYSNVSEMGLRGLTLYFDKVYPTQFTIICNGNGNELFRKQYTNDSMTFVTNDVFSDDATEMIIQIEKMNQPHVRFRLRYVLFGVGVSFNNQNILETGGNLISYMHPCSVELPTQDLNLVLDNYDDSFDFDKEGSLINLTNVGQDITLQVGYTKEDGTIEQIPGTILELSDFNIDNHSLKIVAIDFLRNENKSIVFDDPSFFTSSTTLYDVAVKVKESLENKFFDVVIDDSLKSVPMKFSHIETTVKNALMMIASAGRCIMDLKDKGLFIRRVETSHSNFSVSSNNKAPYSDMNILTPDDVIPFATFELNRTKADGSYLIPKNRTNIIYKTGYISDEISDQYGQFTEIPSFSLNSEEAVSPSYLYLKFNSTHPRKMTITTYYQNELKETLSYTLVSSDMFEILHDFVAFDEMDVEFEEIYDPYSRVYVSYVSFDKNVYDMSSNIYENQKPKASVLEMVRNITVTYTTSVKNEDGYFEDTVKSITVQCNQKGTDIEYDNKFITTIEVAQDVGEWLKKYYSTRIEYDVSYMGDPTIEAYDIIRLESEYNDNLLCDVETCETKFSNGGIRGRIIARRREDELVRTKNKLAIR